MLSSIHSAYAVARLGIQDDELGQLVRVQLAEPRRERLDPVRVGLDEELLFALLFDASLPSIDRRHRRQHVHAGGEPLLDQRSRKRGRVGVGSQGGQDKDELHDWDLYFSVECGT